MLSFCLLACGTLLIAAPPATTVQLPTFGVAISAEGMLRVEPVNDPGARRWMAGVVAARRDLPPDMQAWSDLRKVSLARLEAALDQKVRRGERPTSEMRCLAGLQRVRYAICCPGLHDVILAGPAEGFAEDASGRVVGMTTGRPVLRLEHLATALRVFPPGSRQPALVGCTIAPSADGLQRLAAYQRDVPHVVPQNQRQAVTQEMTRGMLRALGPSQVHTFGVDARTDFARVLLEADYRMKRIGIGLEPPPVPFTTFIAALRIPDQGSLQRWWFVPTDRCVKPAEDWLAVEFVGDDVRLSGEDYTIEPSGRLASRQGRISKANELFTTAFSRKYAEIAAREPLYAQLRQMVDWAVLAAVLCRRDWYGRTGWRAESLRDEEQVATQVYPAASQADCLVASVWKGNRLLSAAGGVGINADELLAPDRLASDDKQELARSAESIRDHVPADVWWWD